MKKYFVFALLLLVAFSCSDKEVCTESCGPLQNCIDGVCECPEDNYKLDNNCVEKRDGYYLGTLDCGCLNEFVFSLSLIENFNQIQILDGFSDKGAGPVTQLSDGSLKATLAKGCNLDNGTSYAVDFTVKELNENELHVHARWWNLEVGTLEECESVFVH